LAIYEKSSDKELLIGYNEVYENSNIPLPQQEIPMPYYRLPNLGLSTRINLALQMLDPSRPWGLVTELAREYQVSRKFLYQQRDKAEAGLLTTLAAQPPGPKPESAMLVVDKEHLQRSIVTLATAVPASIWGIQVCLEEVLDTHRSTGFISQTLKQAGEAATRQNRLLALPQPVLGEADEIFQGRHPCLTVVDGHSFAVIYLSPQEKRDATTWGVSFLELQEQGISFQDVACDGAKGIRCGIQQAELLAPLRPDLFHLLREAHVLTRRLERKAYAAIEQSYKVQRAELEAQSPKSRKGRPLKVHKSVAEAETQEQEAISNYDSFVWLQEEIRQALEPWTPWNMLTSAQQAQETLETAVTLLKELGDANMDAYAKKLQKRQVELVAPLVWLEQQLASHRQGLDPDTEAAIIWAYKHREELGLENPDEVFPHDLHSVVEAFWQALSTFHRSSSLAESLHSWLRPYFQAHRGMPEWLTPLLQLYWNHHTFQRGKRKGKTPLSLAGIDDTASWSQVLDSLLGKAESEAA
jgi:hypothetical protein